MDSRSLRLLTSRWASNTVTRMRSRRARGPRHARGTQRPDRNPCDRLAHQSLHNDWDVGQVGVRPADEVHVAVAQRGEGQSWAWQRRPPTRRRACSLQRSCANEILQDTARSGGRRQDT